MRNADREQSKQNEKMNDRLAKRRKEKEDKLAKMKMDMDAELENNDIE